jgi:hypothetical protein
MLLSLFSSSLFYQEPEKESNQLRQGTTARKRASPEIPSKPHEHAKNKPGTAFG